MHSFTVAAGAFDVVLVQGADAARFLQGQLTCDVATLADNKLVQGACCTNKGRVIAAFTLIRQQDSYFLCMSKGLAVVLMDTLRKYAPFYKQCTLTMPGDHALTAHAGDHAARLLHSHQVGELPPATAASIAEGWICRLPGTPVRALCWRRQSQAPVHSTTTIEQWEALGLLQGEIPFGVHDTGLHTPQELHLDRNGYISFDKGCYTGQEIVARMHYRGKLKKSLFLAILPKPVSVGPMETDSQVTTATGSVIGRCILVRQLDQNLLALVELPADFTGQLTGLAIGGIGIHQGCLFEPTVIQSANLQTA